jgi:hypothetical protein
MFTVLFLFVAIMFIYVYHEKVYVEAYTTCTQIKEKLTCDKEKQKYNDSQCYWDDDNLLCSATKSCSSFANESECENNECIWHNKACSASCSKRKTKNVCSQMSSCFWDDAKYSCNTIGTNGDIIK